MPLAPGTQAPDFVLKSSDAGFPEVRFSDIYADKQVVLLFFPAAFSGVCTTEMCGIKTGQFLTPDENTAVVGVSVDSPFAQAAWKEKEGIPAVLLSDYSHKVIHEYDVAFPNFAGTGGESAARAVYVIAKGGEIKYSAQTASPGELPDFDAVRAALD